MLFDVNAVQFILFQVDVFENAVHGFVILKKIYFFYETVRCLVILDLTF